MVTNVAVHYDANVKAFILLFDLDGQAYAYQIPLREIVSEDTVW